MTRRRYIQPTGLLSLIAAGCFDLTPGSRPPDIDSDTVAATAPADTFDNPCDHVFCNTPPGDACNDDGTIRRRARNGYCTPDGADATCRYDVTYDEPCERGSCEAGAEGPVCTGSPLQGRYCLTPGRARCDGDMLVVPQGPGRAIPGGCRYSERRLPCPDGCDADDGVCRGAPCIGLVCADPPAPYCLDEHTAVEWAPFGRCAEDGACVYPRRFAECREGCAQGRCRERHPCEGVFCTTPPADFCLDADTLFDYAPLGRCQDGGCVYVGERRACDGACEDGECRTQPDLGVSCASPPAPACNGPDVLRVWAGAAAPSRNSVCEYALEDITCDHGCGEGRCIDDPCVGLDTYCTAVYLPADYCDGDIAVQMDAGGSCEGAGLCAQAPIQEISCESGCLLGRCPSEQAGPGAFPLLDDRAIVCSPPEWPLPSLHE